MIGNNPKKNKSYVIKKIRVETNILINKAKASLLLKNKKISGVDYIHEAVKRDIKRRKLDVTT